MARWAPDANGRLREAALDLFIERGYEQTTVADIAERAGLTARTFFRHFADKREVLFSGQADLRAAMDRTVADASPGTAPIDVAMAAVAAGGALIGTHREFARRRQSVIDANAELRERELIKMAMLTGAVTDALRERGVPTAEARLAAEVAMTAFQIGFERWAAAPDGPELPAVIHEVLPELRAVAAAGGTATRTSRAAAASGRRGRAG